MRALSSSHPTAIRNVLAGSLFESFFVAAVGTVIVVRLFLELTGYPQIGGHGLHIAHVLWGGLLMLAAIVLDLSYINPTMRRVRAIVGGIGFGLFIDESGKFVTSNNDYFFQPAIAIIYVVFVALFLAFRQLERHQPLTREERLVNAIELLKEIVGNDFDRSERARAVDLLLSSGSTDPIALELRRIVEQAAVQPAPPPGWLDVAYRRIHDWYDALIDTGWFRWGVVAVFALYSIGSTASILLGWLGVFPASGEAANEATGMTAAGWARLASSGTTAALMLLGAVELRRSYLAAYRFLRTGILVSLFVNQVFSFYLNQLAALVILALSVFALAALHHAIRRERRIWLEKGGNAA